MNLRVLEGNSP